ncbi:MAG: hypothetical protein VX498_00365 [Myxococcota bacterium]|nr:hypothetical protein [Myxococcota bacterium]
MRRVTRVLSLALLGLFLLVPVAGSQPANMDEWCPDPDPEQDSLRYFRSLSLDLRGYVPSVEEYAVVEEAGEVPESLIDEWLHSDDFLERAARKHRDLLWNNISNFGYLGNPTQFRTSGDLMWRRDVAINYRGSLANLDPNGDGRNELRPEVPCKAEPAEWDEDGNLIFEDMGDGTQREGYVAVTDAYFDGGDPTTYYVCAADAQDNMVSPSGTDCGSRQGWNDPECGCGPNLRWCRYGNSEVPVRRAFGAQVDQKVKQVIGQDRPYTDLFLDNTIWMNGPLAYFWKHQAQLSTTILLTPKPVPVDDIPEMDYQDEDTWVPVQGTSHHAGVLTSPAYLVRFMSDRGRANRFYNAFLCQPFQPPEVGLPAADDSAALVLDLQQRDGCKYCHSTLEPVAAHWGRWISVGGAYLDTDEYPAFSQECYDCAINGGCNSVCRAYYVTSAFNEQEEPYLGWLAPYKFRRDDHKANVEDGPRRLVETTVEDGRLTNCTVRTAAEWMVGRTMYEFEEDWLVDLQTDFVDSGYSYRELVRGVVTSPVYRRVR